MLTYGFRVADRGARSWCATFVWAALAVTLAVGLCATGTLARAQERADSPRVLAGGYDCVSTFVATWWSPEPERHTGRSDGDLWVRALAARGRRVGVRWSSDPDCELVADVGADGGILFPPDQRCTTMNDVTELVVRLVSGRGRVSGRMLEVELLWRTDGRRWPLGRGEPDISYAGSSSERSVCEYRGPGTDR